MFLWLFLYPFVVWAALLVAQSLGGNLLELLTALTDALQNPFAIRWTEKSLPAVLICTTVYIMAGGGTGRSTAPPSGATPGR